MAGTNDNRISPAFLTRGMPRRLNLLAGEVVWETRLASRVGGGTATYSVDGRQYIAVVAGSGLVSSAGITREVDFLTGGDAVYVFALSQ